MHVRFQSCNITTSYYYYSKVTVIIRNNSTEIFLSINNGMEEYGRILYGDRAEKY